MVVDIGQERERERESELEGERERYPVWFVSSPVS